MPDEAVSDSQFAQWLSAVNGPRITASGSENAPLSLAQERLWFLYRLNPDDPVYNVPTAIRLRGALDVESLRKSIDLVANRHAILRTYFTDDDGTPRQHVVETIDIPVSYVDLRELPPDRRRDALGSQLTDEATRTFDLRRAPLLRAHLWNLGDEHLLLLCMHHIVCDGWSVTVLLRELLEQYTASCTGQDSPLREPPIQYGDFARWQRTELAGPKTERLLAHWRERLAGAPTVLQLPNDLPRPAVYSNRGDRRDFVLPPEVHSALRRIAEKANATLFMTLLSVFGVLVKRYSGQSDVLIGTAVAGRTIPETDALVGFFINTLPLRLRMADDPAFSEFLGRVREVALDAYEHQDLPFEEIIKELRLERDPSRPPLVQVTLVVQNSVDVPASSDELSVEIEDVPTGTSKFELSVSFMARPDGLHGTIGYNTDLFSPAMIDRMVGHLLALIAVVVEDPDARLSRLPMVVGAEAEALTSDFGGHPGGDGRLVHDVFRDAAARRRGEVAVVCGDRRLTHEELGDRSDRLALKLQRAGVGPETMVGVHLPPSPELVVAFLAILKSGGAYVPLDPELPAERMAFILDDVAATVVIGSGGAAYPADVVVMDARGAGPGVPERSRVRTGNAAYVTYTSGSTGRPKGVVITHANLIPMIEWCGHHLYDDTPVRIVERLSPSFDFGIYEMIMSLASGGCLVIPTAAERDSASRFVDLCVEQRVEALHITPSQLTELCRVGRELPSLKFLFVGGEEVPWRVIDAVRTVIPPGCRIINGYGPTENSVTSTARIVHGADSWHGRAPSMPIGSANCGTWAYVLDGRMSLVPTGVVGELYLAGPGLARSYFQRPGLTADRFLPNPFSATPGERMYRTGDLVRRLGDGQLVFLGRNDRQVKLRGHRIELGEIEATLLTHPSVDECVCEIRPEPAAIVAYVGTADPARLDARELRRFLYGRLPRSMVPSIFEIVTELPRNPMGKADVRMLAGSRASGAPPDGGQEPRTATERRLAGIWGDVLDRSAIGVDTNFFEIGGNSLLAMRIVDRILAEFDVEVPLIDLFEAQTLAELATKVDELRAADSSTVPEYVKRLQDMSDDEVRSLLAEYDAENGTEAD